MVVYIGDDKISFENASRLILRSDLIVLVMRDGRG